LKFDVHLIPGDERLAVFIQDKQTANGGGKGVGVEFYLFYRNLAVKLGGQLLNGNSANDGRQNEEASNSIEKQKTQDPIDEFAFPRRQ
jgi:hypothetical protein